MISIIHHHLLLTLSGPLWRVSSRDVGRASEYAVYEFLAALISFFLIQPLQAEMADRFGNISREQVTSVTTCIREATPVFIQQATDQPWQTATQVFGIWSGMTAPEEVLAETTPGCADTIRGLQAGTSQES